MGVVFCLVKICGNHIICWRCMSACLTRAARVGSRVRFWVRQYTCASMVGHFPPLESLEVFTDTAVFACSVALHVFLLGVVALIVVLLMLWPQDNRLKQQHLVYDTHAFFPTRPFQLSILLVIIDYWYCCRLLLWTTAETARTGTKYCCRLRVLL